MSASPMIWLQGILISGCLIACTKSCAGRGSLQRTCRHVPCQFLTASPAFILNPHIAQVMFQSPGTSLSAAVRGGGLGIFHPHCEVMLLQDRKLLLQFLPYIRPVHQVRRNFQLPRNLVRCIGGFRNGITSS